MPVITIADLTDDERTKLVFAKRMRAGNSKDLEDGTRYAVVLIKLHASVAPSDYPALRTSMVDIAGIQDVDLLIDAVTPSSVPANHTQVLQVGANIQLRDDT